MIGGGCRPVLRYRVDSPQVRTKSAVVDPRAGATVSIPEADVANELAESTDSGQRREEDGDSPLAGNTSQAEASDR